MYFAEDPGRRHALFHPLLERHDHTVLRVPGTSCLAELIAAHAPAAMALIGALNFRSGLLKRPKRRRVLRLSFGITIDRCHLR